MSMEAATVAPRLQIATWMVDSDKVARRLRTRSAASFSPRLKDRNMTQIDHVAGQVSALVLCHTRELAYQICHEFERFSTYLPDLKVAVFYGGVSIKLHKDLLKNERPHVSALMRESLIRRATEISAILSSSAASANQIGATFSLRRKIRQVG